MMNRYSLLEKIGLYIAIAIFLIFILLPFFEMFMTSLKPLTHLRSAPYKFWDDNFSFDAYRHMWVTVPKLGRYIFNGVFIAGAVTVLAMIFIIPAAYAFARFEFRGKATTLSLFLAVNMFAGAVLLIPLYRVLRTLHLLNTYYAMIIPGAAFLVPMGIWLLKSYLEKIPKELEEAAYVDGASKFYTLRRVMLPLAGPGLMVVGVSVFIGAYAQQYLFAITFNQNSDYMPLPAGVFEFIGYQDVVWNEMMAASLVGVLPVMLIFLFMQRFLIAGLTAGAIKE